MDINSMKDGLKARLKEKRYQHSMAVADEAKALAEIFGASADDAYIAGVLHDCAKNLNKEEAMEVSQRYGYEIDSVTLRFPPVIHAPVGAIVAEKEFGITNPEILDAIRYHTVAREKMTLLDKIIYVADLTEPNRDFCGVKAIRELSRKDIDLCYREALKRSLMFNIEKGREIHPDTLYAWNEICKINKGRKDI